MKSKSLKENKDFRRLYYRGKSSASKNLVTYVMKCKRPGVRVGITTGKNRQGLSPQPRKARYQGGVFAA